MSKVTKYQKFEPKTITRAEINFAYYNPRKISESAQEKLKKKLKKIGLLNSLVWNETTGNLVSGHQRLSIIDQLEKTQDYSITVDAVKLSEQEEVEANIFFNNTSAMGEWDIEMLQEIKATFSELDFKSDFGFEKVDLQFFNFPEINEEKSAPKVIIDNKTANEIKNNSRQEYKNNINNQAGICAEPFRNDFMLTIVFNSNNQKWDFMRTINQLEQTKFIKYDDFIEFIRDSYRV